MPKDRWAGAAAYNRFMGRWSRALALEFLSWLGAQPNAHWLEIGCGTGSFTRAILENARPISVTACDISPDFIRYCSENLRYPNLQVLATPQGYLPTREGGFDIVVSNLVLNFMPDPAQSLLQMRQSCADRGIVAASVWDYSDGMEFLRIFWDAAAELDREARQLHEGSRFPICHPGAFRNAFIAAGLRDVTVDSVSIPTVFASFNDYWNAFLDSPGPAPTYVSSLSEESRQRLAEYLRLRLVAEADGSIHLMARAWVATGVKSAAQYEAETDGSPMVLRRRSS